MTPVLAIIPFYRNRAQLDRCLAALAAQQPAPPDVFVHDNSVVNVGFTRAVNLGLAEALRRGFPYALILNQDCYLRPAALAQLVRFMDARPRCAIAGARQVASCDEDFIMHGGCGAAFPAGRHVTGRKSRGDCAESRLMPWVNGACVAARLKAVADFGPLDERMFLVGSDADWCYAARARGWEVWYCADAECVHEFGASARPPDEATRRVMLKDMLYWRDKWVDAPLYRRLSEDAAPLDGAATCSATPPVPPRGECRPDGK